MAAAHPRLTATCQTPGVATADGIEIGIIGGVGHEIHMADEMFLDVSTPYGPTSSRMRVGVLGGRRVGMLIRRGEQDGLQPHLVPYRANIWALASLGATSLVTTTAGGSLRESFPPGVFVVTDQLIDRTHGRPDTFYDEGPAVQLSAADPFDPTLRGLAIESLADQKVRYRDFGTAVVLNGPRFATRAEVRFHAMSGGDLATNTLLPETTLALELAMAVVNVSFVTDGDNVTGHTDAASLEMVKRRVKQARPVLARTAAEIARTIPAGFHATGTVPESAVRSVLARPVV